MDKNTVLLMITTEYCVNITILIMTITIIWLVKQVEILTKVIYNKPEVKDNSTQTEDEKEYFIPEKDEVTLNVPKRRRSHRNGKQNYLRKWPGSYPQ